MKEFRCGDIIPGCTFVTTAETEDEIMQDVARHADDQHGINPVPDDIAEKVRTLIHER